MQIASRRQRAPPRSVEQPRARGIDISRATSTATSIAPNPPEEVAAKSAYDEAGQTDKRRMFLHPLARFVPERAGVSCVARLSLSFLEVRKCRGPRAMLEDRNQVSKTENHHRHCDPEQRRRQKYGDPAVWVVLPRPPIDHPEEIQCVANQEYRPDDPDRHEAPFPAPFDLVNGSTGGGGHS